MISNMWVDIAIYIEKYLSLALPVSCARILYIKLFVLHMGHKNSRFIQCKRLVCLGTESKLIGLIWSPNLGLLFLC